MDENTSKTVLSASAAVNRLMMQQSFWIGLCQKACDDMVTKSMQKPLSPLLKSLFQKSISSAEGEKMNSIGPQEIQDNDLLKGSLVRADLKKYDHPEKNVVRERKAGEGWAAIRVMRSDSNQFNNVFPL